MPSLILEGVLAHGGTVEEACKFAGEYREIRSHGFWTKTAFPVFAGWLEVERAEAARQSTVPRRVAAAQGCHQCSGRGWVYSEHNGLTGAAQCGCTLTVSDGNESAGTEEPPTKTEPVESAQLSEIPSCNLQKYIL